MPVNIHGKQYVTVAERLTEAREHLKSINTEIIDSPISVIIKATVVTDKGTFTGISAANSSKAIEKASPYEVAETSAVGRALGFAGFGAVDSIATADEMVKSEGTQAVDYSEESQDKCPKHHRDMVILADHSLGHEWKKDDGEVLVCHGQGFR